LRLIRRILRFLFAAFFSFLLASTLLVVLYGFVAPPLTPLMAIRLFQGEGLERAWRDYRRISPELFRAVIAAEDTGFCAHRGFDWQAIEQAWQRYQRGTLRLRGGSTISQQAAKNLYLWPGRSFLRKGLEAYFTVLLEAFLSKRRILELYVNTAEWGHGIYGAEAAARAHFGKPADALSRREAALLAAVLPNPRRWSAEKPTSYVLGRASTIGARMQRAGEGDPCG